MKKRKLSEKIYRAKKEIQRIREILDHEKIEYRFLKEKEEIENGGYKWIMLRRSCTSPTTGIMMV